MNEISKNTLLYLALAAILVSSVGTFISLDRLTQFGAPITGFVSANATGTGLAQLTVATGTSIAVTGGIEFGAGHVNTSGATIESNASDYKASNGSGTWDWYTNLGKQGQSFRVENDGNINLSINMSTNVSRAVLVGGTSPRFSAAVSWEESTSCSGTSGDAVQLNAWTEINNTQNVTVCKNLSFATATDELNVSIRLRIPEDTPSEGGATHTALITFYGYQE